METMLVRLQPYDPHRGFVLRRYVYQGIKFHAERGWYRVEKSVADYLRTVREVATDPNSPLAFDVGTDEEAKAIETREENAAKQRRAATDEVKLSPARVDAAVITAADVTPKNGTRDDAKTKDKKA